jgi:hypothetical protein
MIESQWEQLYALVLLILFTIVITSLFVDNKNETFIEVFFRSILEDNLFKYSMKEIEKEREKEREKEKERDIDTGFDLETPFENNINYISRKIKPAYSEDF